MFKQSNSFGSSIEKKGNIKTVITGGISSSIKRVVEEVLDISQDPILVVVEDNLVEIVNDTAEEVFDIIKDNINNCGSTNSREYSKISDILIVKQYTDITKLKDLVGSVDRVIIGIEHSNKLATETMKILRDMADSVNIDIYICTDCSVDLYSLEDEELQYDLSEGIPVDCTDLYDNADVCIMYDAYQYQSVPTLTCSSKVFDKFPNIHIVDKQTSIQLVCEEDDNEKLSIAVEEIAFKSGKGITFKTIEFYNNKISTVPSLACAEIIPVRIFDGPSLYDVVGELSKTDGDFLILDLRVFSESALNSALLALSTLGEGYCVITNNRIRSIIDSDVKPRYTVVI